MIYELSTKGVKDLEYRAIFQSYQQPHVDIEASRVTAITGAGLSLASGLPLGNDVIQGIHLSVFFRRALWEQNAKLGFDVYREVLSLFRSAQPSEAHLVFAQACTPIITQNIDGLHRDAGTQKVIEMHGNLRELCCRRCDGVFSNSLVHDHAVPHCPTCNAQLYPGFTLEGEQVRHFSRAVEWVSESTTLLIVGTQMAMYPVRELGEIAKKRGLPIFWIQDNAEYWIPFLFA